jgi:hypothetical protein
MPAEQSELRVRDIAVKLRRAGRGPKLLFLHGAGGVPQWLPFFDLLAENGLRPMLIEPAIDRRLVTHRGRPPGSGILPDRTDRRQSSPAIPNPTSTRSRAL